MAKVGHLPPPSMAGARLVTEEATAPAGGAAAGWPTPRGEKSLKEDDASDDDSDHASKKKKKKKKAVVSSDEEDDEPRSPPSKHPDKLRRSVQESPMDEPHTPSRPKGSKKKGSGSLPTRIAAAEVHLLGAASKGAFLPRLEALEEAAGIEDPAENTGDRIEAIEAAM
ncbi:hypothetical protein M885DRAFT_509628 [Pelagophyceae sp. CCMP2097]|nr:hypothetical protein M885DRAFT_509628 [Pelagophyceae sp. CCMP2097]